MPYQVSRIAARPGQSIAWRNAMVTQRNPRSNLRNYQMAARMRTTNAHRAVLARLPASGSIYKASKWRPNPPAGWQDALNANYFRDALMRRLGGDRSVEARIAQSRDIRQALQSEKIDPGTCIRTIAPLLKQRDTQNAYMDWLNKGQMPDSATQLQRDPNARPPATGPRYLSNISTPELETGPPPPLWPMPEAEPGIRGWEEGQW